MKNTRSGEMLLIHCTQASKSGAAKYVNELFHAIRRLDSNARLVCPENFEYRKTHPEANITAISQMDGKNTIDKLRSMAGQFIFATKYIVQIARRNNERVTLAHFNFPGLHFFAFCQFKKLRRSGVRLALTVHDVLPHRWLLPAYLNGCERWFLKGIYHCADVIFVHHESQAEKMVRDFGVSKARITVVHHGVFSLSAKPLLYRAGKEYVALCFGAIRENKGLLPAIEAVQKLRSEGVPVRLVIAGAVSQGESSYWSKCMAQIDFSPDGIDVIEGYIPESDIREYFERSSFVLLPYSDFFSQSGVATMALSSGRVIVSTDSGGLNEMLLTGKYGFRIASSSVDAIQIALREAVSVGHFSLSEMGKAAFEYFSQNYSWDAAAQIQFEVCRNAACRR